MSETLAFFIGLVFGIIFGSGMEIRWRRESDTSRKEEADLFDSPQKTGTRSPRPDSGSSTG